jgi:hypothetical protein
MNRDQPLWMPPGSVRSLMALMVTATFCYVAIRSQIEIEAKDLVTIVILILGFYFIAKAAVAAGRRGGSE